MTLMSGATRKDHLHIAANVPMCLVGDIVSGLTLWPCKHKTVKESYSDDANVKPFLDAPEDQTVYRLVSLQAT